MADEQLSELESNGIKQNGKLSFRLQFQGREIYRLLALLEQIAVQEQSYLRVRESVLFAEAIREQCKKQGW